MNIHEQKQKRRAGILTESFLTKQCFEFLVNLGNWILDTAKREREKVLSQFTRELGN